MVERRGPKRVILPKLILGEVCNPADDGATERVVNLATGPFRYFFRPYSALPRALRDRRTSSFNHASAVVDTDGAPWHEACAYLTHIINAAGMPAIGIDNALSAGSDLAAFMRFLKETKTDFQTFPAFEPARPTYKYHAYLVDLAERKVIEQSVARRRMLTVIGMYDWLMKKRLLLPEYPPWEEKTISVGFESRTGSFMLKERRTTDLRIKAVPPNSPYDDHIADGGKLRPLPELEQEVLLKTLQYSDNVEARFLHILMLDTCARTQTAFTLRARHFMEPIEDDIPEVGIPAGPGTSVDTKGSKPATLYVSGWLYRRLCVYANSPRAEARRRRSKVNPRDPYLFLTNRGTPYYESVEDRSTFDPDEEGAVARQGGGLRQFIHDWMLPRMRQQLGSNYRYRAQDLRATGGMNMTTAQLALVEAKVKTLAQARRYVQARMWHEHGETTDRYLGFKYLREYFHGMQHQYESHLETLMKRAADASEQKE
ncbi:hypothetical protein [Burkholderia pseudomallei]|uniref:hypothetical protein n=1 Tax=Burkholderia pseudomallei TaxID=28450 RepID=UPI00201AF34B|nr:hypothetical protein [Burkholderia pseudomallei]MCL4667843.1 hypothetical protein [Burkholderia pseudomallei]